MYRISGLKLVSACLWQLQEYLSITFFVDTATLPCANIVNREISEHPGMEDLGYEARHKQGVTHKSPSHYKKYHAIYMLANNTNFSAQKLPFLIKLILLVTFVFTYSRYL